MPRFATAYLRANRIFLCPMSLTDQGVGIANEPVLVAGPEDSDESNGDVVMQALEHSRQGVPHPTDWRGLVKPLMLASGTKSWNDFAKTAICCEIVEEGENVVLIPTRPDDKNRSFQRVSDLAISLCRPSHHELGKALGDCFQRARP